MWKYLRDSISSVTDEIGAHKANLTPPLIYWNVSPEE